MILTEEEQRCAALEDRRLSEAVQTLREDGFVVLERALPDILVRELREQADAFVIENLHNRERLIPTGINHYHLVLPIRPPYLDPHVLENPVALQIVESVLGPALKSRLPYGGNVAMPGSEMQRIHRDGGAQREIRPIGGLVVNIPLVDFTEENGSTEVWPGTHLVTDVDEEDAKPARLLERAAKVPSVRMNVPAGSVVVRDTRMWHRGMPNRTQTIRVMLAPVYSRKPASSDGVDPMRIPREEWESLSPRSQRMFWPQVIVDQSIEQEGVAT